VTDGPDTVPTAGPPGFDGYERLYVLLAALFIASLISCNLIFLKFFTWDTGLFGLTFVQSVGILPYPITFLVTDILSECYGTKRAQAVVTAGFAASVFVLGIVWVADASTAVDFSPLDDAEFHRAFGMFGVGVLASMAAYLAAQYLDVRIFRFWRRLTDGRHLWLRNIGSTTLSQVVDTAAVLGLLCAFGALSWAQFGALFLNGVLFKWVFAAADTPLFYGATALMKRWFPEQVAAAEREELGRARG
jgi:queuosine precursor transporter